MSGNSHPSSLCEICSSFTSSLENIRRLTMEEHLLIPLDLRSVAASRDRGCRFCQVIWDQVITNNKKVREHFEQNSEADSSFQLLAKGGYDKRWDPANGWREILPEWADLHTLYVHAFFNGLNQVSSIGTFDVYANRNDPAAAFISTRPPNGYLDSPESYDTIKNWLYECLTDHPQCPTAMQGLLPTRVLDVGITTNSELLHLHVSDAGELGQYAALSYCWGGGSQPVITTTSNLEAHKEYFDLELLPNTIVDAIIVTRKLGIRYLWIDALCILQDSNEDKDREIDNMKNIYKNAHITISAACTRTCHDGFLESRTRDPQTLQFEIRYACPNGTMGNIILQTPQHYIRPENEPLNKRGWTLQERILSPRLLIYGVTDLYWECQTKHASNGGKGTFWTGSSQRGRDPLLTSNPEETIESKGSRWRKNWMDIVEDYTTRSLTVAEDKLTAISSVAESLSFENDTYVAGLWESWLLEGLMWFVPHIAISAPPWHVTQLHSRAKDYIAPSWSWASINSPVTHASKTHYKGISGVCPELKVLKCEVVSAPLSRVSGGSLALMGFLRPALWDIGAKSLTLPGMEGKVISSDTFQDAIEAEEDYSSPLEVWCLRLRLNQGMILKMRPGSQTGYTRVGWFRTSENSFFEGSVPQLITIF